MTNFEDITIRKKISSHGGGIEVDLTDIVGYPVQMTAYQNYLGGGMLGRVASDCDIENWKENDELVEIAYELRQYFHGLTNPDDSVEGTSFEQNQKLPISAY